MASAKEAREYLLSQEELPEGVVVGQRGRLSAAAKAHFTAQTGQTVDAEQRNTDRSEETVSV